MARRRSSEQHEAARSSTGHSVYGGSSPIEIPAYTLGDAARYLGIPASTLRYWLFGRRADDGKSWYKPLIKLEGIAAKKKQMAFSHLVEAHVLCSIRRSMKISMPKVRKALLFVEKKKGVHRPLIHETFETDGLDLFVEHYGALVNTAEPQQLVMRKLMDAYLQRIERDEQGMLRRLYPFTQRRDDLDQPRYIMIDPAVSFGRPVIAGTGIPTEIVARRFFAGDDVDALARDYECDRVQIQEAIRCEQAKAA